MDLGERLNHLVKRLTGFSPGGGGRGSKGSSGRGLLGEWRIASLKRRAESSLRQGQYDEAIRAYEELMSNGEDKPGYAHNIGICYMAKQDYVSARTWFKKAVDRDPKEPVFKAGLAETYMLMGDWDEAKRYFEQARELDKSNRLYRARIVALEDPEKRERLRESFRLLTEAAELYKQRKWRESLELYEKTLEFDAMGKVHNQVGVIYHNVLKDYEKALAAFEKAVELSGGNKLYERNRDMAKAKLAKASRRKGASGA